MSQIKLNLDPMQTNSLDAYDIYISMCLAFVIIVNIWVMVDFCISPTASLIKEVEQPSQVCKFSVTENY